MNPDEIRRGELERDRLLAVNRVVPQGLRQTAPLDVSRCAICGSLMTPGLCCVVDQQKAEIENLKRLLRFSLPQLEDLATRQDTLDAWVGHEVIPEIRAALGKKA